MSLIKEIFNLIMGDFGTTFIHNNKISQFNNFAFQEQQVFLVTEHCSEVSLRPGRQKFCRSESSNIIKVL